MIGSGLIVAAQFAVFLLIGVGLACFYQAGDGAREFAARDQVFATFIVEQLPRGVVGITLAAVFSAAMSTLSSSLNASANAAVSDFFRPLAAANVSDKRLLMVSRVATILFGVGQMAIAMASERLFGGRSTVYQVLAIAGFTTGPILGLFFLAAWPKPVSQRAALAGFATGLVVLTCVAFQPWEVYQINDLYYSFIGSMVTFSAGLAVSTFLGRTSA
jgi:Na+/proline symporter